MNKTFSLKFSTLFPKKIGFWTIGHVGDGMITADRKISKYLQKR